MCGWRSGGTVPRRWTLDTIIEDVRGCRARNRTDAMERSSLHADDDPAEPSLDGGRLTLMRRTFTTVGHSVVRQDG